MALLVVIGLVLTVIVWVNFGAIWGLIAGFLLVGGVGWVLVFGLAGRLLRPGWGQFVKAWEGRLGDPKRSGWDVPDHELWTINEAYRRWRQDHRSSGVSAAQWLDERRLAFEVMGFEPVPSEGEVRIRSDWQFDIWTVDVDGRPQTDGDHYAAVRWFEYEVVGPFGSGTSWTHSEPCVHVHASRQEAGPCLEVLRGIDAKPSLDDVGRPWPRKIAVAEGTYFDDGRGESYTGEIAASEFGLIAPLGPDRQLLLEWDQLGGLEKLDSGRGFIVQKTFGSGRLHFSQFPADTEARWLELLQERGTHA